MVLNKWAALTKSAPPRVGLRPLARHTPQHPRLVPGDYKTPYVLRPFIKDLHVSNVQYIENRGMLQEELCVERGRFPRMNKVLTVQTDGSLNEREFEFAVPPIITLFQDRLSMHRRRQLALAKLGKLRRADSWQTTTKGEQSLNPVCNALTFPYCVPAKMLMRPCAVDPLSTRTQQTKKADSIGDGDDLSEMA